MGIEGLQVHSFVGWAMGLLPLDNPWGVPSFTSWISWWTLLCFIFSGFQLITFVDLVQSSYSVVDSFVSSIIAVYLNTFILTVGLVSYVSFKLILLLHAKSFSRLFVQIYNFKIQNASELNKSWRKSWVLLKIFGVSSLVLVFIQSIFFGFTVTERSRNEDGHNDSWFAFLGVFTPFPIFFMYLTSVSIRPIIFMIISCVAFNVTMIYEDFCILLEESGNMRKSILKKNQRDVEDVLKSIPIVSVTILDSEVTKKWKMFEEKKKSKVDSWNHGEDLVDRFEEIEALLHEATRLLSPLVLVQVVTTVVVLVTDSYLAIVGGKIKSSHIVVCLLAVSENLIYTGLVFVGQKVEDRFAARRSNLKKSLVLNYGSVRSSHHRIVEVTSLVVNLDWRLSACGIFFVDRKLLSGIMSTAMSYTVILIQFQLTGRSFSTGRNNGSEGSIEL